MKSSEINIGDEMKVYIWDLDKHLKCKIINKYRDYKKTCWADFCYDVELLEDKQNSTITNEGFLADAFMI